MSKKGSAWGMEIGASAIKAIRLERDGNEVRVTDFANIPHKKVLTTPDVDQDELVRLSLGQFISQKSLEGEHLVMSVPGHAAFARFAKLPPVEPKKVPDIVKFEAVQQIPFPIEQVEWDYQTFVADDSPEVEVGIFAITRERVQQRLALYAELGISPEAINLGPVAVYNAMSFDQNLEEHDGPVIFLDIGTNATDVIVVEEGRCWIRTFPLGGTHFTEAIASAFKLSYGKAEKLKYEAATSKYAKQLMQAMRPVFSDLLQDLQRSIGYYQTAHSDKELATMVGLGSTFKIPGLRKFLGQQLQLNVVRLDEYRKIQVTGREAASFAENAVNMATAYGLALQGVGLGGIDANLVPTGVLREAMWHQKTKWFAAAAAIVVLGSGMMLLRPFTDKAAMEPTAPPIVDTTIANGNRLRTEFEQIKSSANVGFKATNMMRLLENRTIWPQLVTDVSVALASTGPQDALLGDNVAEIMSIKPEDRRFIELEQLSGAYVPPAGAGGTRSIDVTMYLELSHERPDEFLNDTVADWLRSNAEREGVPYRITNVSINPSMMSTITVDDDGIETTRGGDGSSGSRPRSGGSSSGDDRTGGNNDGPPQRRKPGGARKPPGPGGGGGGGMGAGGGGGTGMGSGSDIPSRRKPGQNTRKPPGPGGGGGGGMGTQGSGGSGMSSGGGGGQPQAPRPGADPKQLADIDGLAPIGSLPNRYPAGSKYYKVPVTFTVEIIDQDKPAAGDQTARANGAEEQRS